MIEAGPPERLSSRRGGPVRSRAQRPYLRRLHLWGEGNDVRFGPFDVLEVGAGIPVHPMCRSALCR